MHIGVDDAAWEPILFFNTFVSHVSLGDKMAGSSSLGPSSPLRSPHSTPAVQPCPSHTHRWPHLVQGFEPDVDVEIVAAVHLAMHVHMENRRPTVDGDDGLELLLCHGGGEQGSASGTDGRGWQGW